MQTDGQTMIKFVLCWLNLISLYLRKLLVSAKQTKITAEEIETERVCVVIKQRQTQMPEVIVAKLKNANETHGRITLFKHTTSNIQKKRWLWVYQTYFAIKKRKIISHKSEKCSLIISVYTSSHLPVQLYSTECLNLWNVLAFIPLITEGAENIVFSFSFHQKSMSCGGAWEHG